MELAINVGYTNGEIVFKDKNLTTKTKLLFKEMTKARNSLCRVGLILDEINTKRLYEKDFVDLDGKPSFAEYCGTVLGISKTSAYRIIKTAKTLLFPEQDSKNKFFTSYGDTQLYLISQIGDYNESKEFCEKFNIDELSTKSEITKALKKFKPDVFDKEATKNEKPKKEKKPKEIEIETTSDNVKPVNNETEIKRPTVEIKDLILLRNFALRVIEEFNPNLMDGEKEALDKLFDIAR